MTRPVHYFDKNTDYTIITPGDGWITVDCALLPPDFKEVQKPRCLLLGKAGLLKFEIKAVERLGPKARGRTPVRLHVIAMEG